VIILSHFNNFMYIYIYLCGSCMCIKCINYLATVIASSRTSSALRRALPLMCLVCCLRAITGFLSYRLCATAVLGPVCQFSEAHCCSCSDLHVPHWIPSTSCTMDLAVRASGPKVQAKMKMNIPKKSLKR